METSAKPAGSRKARLSEVPAVERAFDILEFLSSHAEGCTLSELSAALELPHNGVFRITQTLLARGYLSRDETTKRFRLTTRLLTVGQPRYGEVSLVECALGPMRELREQTKETVQLGIRVGDEGVIIEKVEGLHALRISVDLGLRFGLHNNAPGKLLLAFQSAHDRDQDIRRLDLPRFTARTITDREDLRVECVRILEKGFSTDYGEADEGIHCVATPVVGPHNQVLAALWVSAPARRMPKEMFTEIGQWTKAAANKVGAKLTR
ncbi:MAG TPA: IclR family transcriptional regulator [Candidatus Limnocylindria bacterium]|jgi:DNA-binding IclR family transcriptional regulator|nr:IclR family transcriptional regulator [Candidatus Limnocylindria bacterium]